MSVRTSGSIALFEKLSNKPKSRRVAAIVALLGSVTPTAGLHKFYLGQPLWGIIYFMLLWAAPPLPHIACAIEAVWYLIAEREQFDRRFNQSQNNSSALSIAPIELEKRESALSLPIAETLRELDRLREDGLISEYEFEQKRRQLLERL